MKPLVAEVTLHWLLGRIDPEDCAGSGGKVGGQAGCRTGGGCDVGGESGDSRGVDHLLQAYLRLHLNSNHSTATHTESLGMFFQGANLACWTVDGGMNFVYMFLNDWHRLPAQWAVDHPLKVIGRLSLV